MNRREAGVSGRQPAAPLPLSFEVAHDLLRDHATRRQLVAVGQAVVRVPEKFRLALLVAGFMLVFDGARSIVFVRFVLIGEVGSNARIHLLHGQTLLN